MSWYKKARRNEYQSASKKITTYIFEQFKKYGTNQEFYQLGVDELNNIIKNKDFLWNNLNSISVNYYFKDMDQNEKLNISASMSNLSNMKIYIEVDLIIANTKPETIYQDFYYELYASINHELEHSRQELDARRDKTGIDYARSEGGETLYEILSSFRGYLLQQIEIEAYAVGVYRKAISQKRNPIEVIKEYAYQVLPSPQDIEIRLKNDGETYRYQEITELVNNIATEFINKVSTYLTSRFPNFKENNYELV